MNDDISILILSYDGSSDLWTLLFKYFDIYWKDCPFKKFIITNEVIINCKDINTLKVGPDKGWSDNLMLALKRIKTPYVLIWYDDAFLNSKVDTNKVLEYVKLVVKNEFDYFRLSASPKPNKRINVDYGKISRGALYRVSLFGSVIKTEVLKNLLCSGEDAWMFEFNGSIRSDSYENFFSTYKPYFPHYHAVIRGQWAKEVVELLKRNGINTETRGIYNGEMVSKFKMIEKIKKKLLLGIIPPKYQRGFLRYYQSFK